MPGASKVLNTTGMSTVLPAAAAQASWIEAPISVGPEPRENCACTRPLLCCTDRPPTASTSRSTLCTLVGAMVTLEPVCTGVVLETLVPAPWVADSFWTTSPGLWAPGPNCTSRVGLASQVPAVARPLS